MHSRWLSHSPRLYPPKPVLWGEKMNYEMMIPTKRQRLESHAHMNTGTDFLRTDELDELDLYSRLVSETAAPHARSGAANEQTNTQKKW